MPLTPIADALSALKATTLTRIAASCGLRSARTKKALVAELPAELKPMMDPQRPHRILSIDMGVRNLAYCLLTVDPSKRPDADQQLAPGNPTDLLDMCEPRYDSRGMQAPAVLPSLRVEAWNRIDLTQTALLPGDVYGPPTLAPIACDLVMQQFLPLRPNYILIERQRHRTGGHAAVLEWTFRVNMLEGMLWTALEALRRQTDGPAIETVAVLPQRVNQMLLTDEREASKLKELKMELVRDWLVTGRIVPSSQAAAAENTGRQFLQRHERSHKAAPRKSKKENAPKDALPASSRQKLDDLADSLLQGVAWVQWEANKRAIMHTLTTTSTIEATAPGRRNRQPAASRGQTPD